MTPQLPQQTMTQSIQSVPSAVDRVEVPRIGFQPCSVLQAQMWVENPLRSSGNFGIDLYQEVIGIVGQHLSRGCTQCNYFSHN